MTKYKFLYKAAFNKGTQRANIELFVNADTLKEAEVKASTLAEAVRIDQGTELYALYLEKIIERQERE